jgi:hypothetical protein
MPTWPLKLIFNTDGHWIINFKERWEPTDITRMMPDLARGGGDVLSVLIGIDDGHDLMQTYINGARSHDLAVYASMRMNDALNAG